MRASLLSLWLALAFALTLALVACAGARKIGTQCNPRSASGLPEPSEPLVSNVELSVTNLTESEAVALRAQVFTGDVQNVVLRSFDGGTAVYDVELRACECEMPAQIARIPTPGLKYQGRVTRLQYSAFDNQPPELTFVLPEREDARLIANSEQLVVVQAKDLNLAEVTVNGVLADRYRPDVYLARIRLKEGPSHVVAWARDHAGNESTLRMRVRAVPAPSGDAAVWKTIDGKTEPGSTVLVERREIPVDGEGRYRAVIPLPRGQDQIEIMEISPEGKKTVSVKLIR